MLSGAFEETQIDLHIMYFASTRLVISVQNLYQRLLPSRYFHFLSYPNNRSLVHETKRLGQEEERDLLTPNATATSRTTYCFLSSMFLTRIGKGERTVWNCCV